MKVFISLSANLDKFKQTLVKLCSEYHRHVPITTISDYANATGFRLVDEDGSDWEGILTGRDGRASIALSDLSGKPLHEHLHIQWYKMSSGKYELNAYIS